MEEGKNHRILKSILLWTSLVFLFAAGSAARFNRASVGFSKPKILAKFTFESGKDHILLPVNFKGRDYIFILDTGSSYTVFDAIFKNELGDVKKTIKVTTPAETITVEVFDAPEAFFGPFNLQCCGEVCCIDIRKLDFIANEDVSGIIGMDFLRKHRVQIDFDSGLLSFFESEGGENSNWGQALPIRYRSKGIPQIAGTVLSNISEGFLIDTGCAATGSLDMTIFQSLLFRKKLQTLESSYQTLGGDINVREARIKSLSFGTFEYENLIFMEGKKSSLGLPFLTRHTVTFDFPNKKIYLQRSKSFNKADEVDMSGLGLFRHSDKTVVWSVRRGSPAHKADIRPRDVILKIGNKSTRKYKIWEIEQLLKTGDNCMIILTIKRGPKIKEESFVLRKRI
jgi:hypothetical protein